MATVRMWRGPGDWVDADDTAHDFANYREAFPLDEEPSSPEPEKNEEPPTKKKTRR
jgi:hypothetical protein